MAKKFLVNLDMGKNEVQNLRLHILASAPGSPVTGQTYYNSTDNKPYCWNGSGWTDMSGAGAAMTYGGSASSLTFGGSQSPGAASTVSRSDHVHAMPAHDSAAHSAIPLNALATATANYAMGNFKITGLGTPTAAADAANKQYVDDARAGLDAKDSVVVATTANITLSGTQTIDAIAVTAGQRVLVKNQTTASENGLYLCAAGAWTRTTDGQVGTTLTIGSIVFVESGTASGGKQMALTATNVWSAYSAGTTYTGSLGVSLVGADFRIDAAYASFTNYTTTANLVANYQAKDADLTAIAALAGTSGFLKKTATDTWALDTSTYLTANQTITLSGDATGSGTTAITVSIPATTVTGKLLTGFVAGANSAVAATDSILAGLQKLQGQVTARVQGSDVHFIGTTSIALNRASVAQALTGITSIDGKAATVGNTHDATGRKVWHGTQAAYNALTKDGDTVYHITDAANTSTLKYAVTITGTATSEVITHNLNSRDIICTLYNATTPWEEVECDVEMTSVNTVTLRFATAPTAGQYRFVAIG
jgi:hypothetical protein